jgi:hypothetical protein
MFDFFKKAVRANLSANALPPAPPNAFPLGLRVGAAVTIDALPFRVLGSELLFKLPAGQQMVEARGMIDLGQGAVLHRFYLSDDAFVQAQTQAGELEELKLFQFAETKHPNTRAALEAWLKDGSELGRDRLTVKGKEFFRVWGDENAHYSPPIVFDENVYKQNPLTPDYDVTHYAMLYERSVTGSERMEYLLVSVEDSGPNDFCVVFSLGVDVSAADLEII